ncbi:hypothetical protein CO116_00920 [Candidatus Falkowbacteria bacterium CG_4_9_14_3_um_filter_38_19]|uniref:Transposase IS200-like domain-containing protein n=2 Tax=Candidatus Falkowiibacteriota TaxID=1752728 RepID=A0A2M6WQZ4_9BACT|nr:hypothetical protein [Candidatus Falkowbacteria bacterium]PIT95238.1 MAG: hypothetical protein COT96_01745 [Candidatus Falkowbacteria bacterium CG10_big_fil_rev_8_21_14_0_10_38_22]PJB17425.1 MAG: hypothetical protein CO116_00920 [Candidatus Falkowbacteria bacterium CG_4_9_14_3_um_filter_38_19]
MSSQPNLVDIICYCLNPNHYHLLIKQLVNDGVSKFMHKISISYTNYFNQKNNRSGSLFQGTYKTIEIKSNEHLQKLSCYINGNPEIHGIAKAKNWPWSSCQDYLGLRRGTLCNKSKVLTEFKNINEYKKLLYKIIKDLREQKAEIKIMQLEGL